MDDVDHTAFERQSYVSDADFKRIKESMERREKDKAKHTPEPWRTIKENGKIRIIQDKPGEFSLYIAEFDMGLNEEANADRAVACVNGCEGINPGAVKDMYEALVVVEDFWSNPQDQEEKYDAVARRVVKLVADALDKAKETS